MLATELQRLLLEILNWLAIRKLNPPPVLLDLLNNNNTEAAFHQLPNVEKSHFLDDLGLLGVEQGLILALLNTFYRLDEGGVTEERPPSLPPAKAISVICAECGMEFILSTDEPEYKIFAINNAPLFCPVCRELFRAHDKELIYDTPEFEKAFNGGRVFVEKRYDPLERKPTLTVRPIAEKPTLDTLTSNVAYNSPGFEQAYNEGWLIFVNRYDPVEHALVQSFRLVEDGSILFCVDCNQEFKFYRKELQHYLLQDEVTLTRCPSCREFHKKQSASKTNVDRDTFYEEAEIIDYSRASLKYVKEDLPPIVEEAEDGVIDEAEPPPFVAEGEDEVIVEKAAPKSQTSLEPSVKMTSQRKETVSSQQQRQAPKEEAEPKQPPLPDNPEVQYQPATGFSRLGKDTQTGDYVDVPQASRRQGLYIIGANGTGKTGLIEHLILQDINQGLGVGLLDPHGDLTNAILAKMTKREEDVIVLDIQDEDHPFGINLFECPNPHSNTAVQKIVDLVMHIFEKLYDVSRQTPRMAQFLRNCTHTLVANPGYTMADIPLLLQDAQCRKKLVANVTDPKVRLFWQTYEVLRPSEQFDRAESTLNKMDELLQPLTSNIVGQAHTTVNIQQVMDERKILLVKLSAQLDQVTSLVGTLFIALFLNAAYSRANIPVNKRKQFNLYADEFQRFATEDFATLLTEARKFGIATTIAHQARYQPGMTDGIRAVSLQAANYVVFRVTSPDADELAGGFDITPQEAWEEELEEERLEIREPERLETLAVTDGEEAAITYKRDVVGHLLHQGHENPAVEAFVRKHLVDLDNASKEKAETLSGLISVGYGSKTEDVLGYEVLEWIFSAPWSHCPNLQSGKLRDELKTIMKWDKKQTPEESRKYDSYDHRVCYRWEYDNYGFYWYDPYVVRKDLLTLNNFLFDAMRGKIADVEASLFATGIFREPGEWGLSAFLGFDTYYYVTYCAMSHEAREAFFKIIDITRTLYKDTHLLKTLKSNRSSIVDEARHMCQNQICPWIPALYFDKYPNEMNYKAHVYDAEKNRYEWFVSSLLETVKALRQDPIRTSESGIYQPRTRQQILMHPEKTFAHPRKVITHPQRTYQDVRNDIANQLSSMLNFTTRVKLSESAPQNPGKHCLYCKQQNRLDARYCKECGKLLPAPNEYVIETLPPEKGLYGKLLQDRIARIQTSNIRDGILRNRAAVEAEITQRQLGCSSGATPPQKQPQQPTLQQQAHHVRQVPFKKTCPNCETHNNADAKFCNQCGTQL